MSSVKNCAKVIPKAEQMASKVEIEGTVFLLCMLAIVDEESPDSVDNL